MEHFEMYWITNRHHDQVKHQRTLSKARRNLITSQAITILGGVAVWCLVMCWLASLGV